jgi:hypothetical protein
MYCSRTPTAGGRPNLKPVYFEGKYMKKHISDNFVLVSIFFIIVSAGIYFVDSNLSTPSSPSKSALSTTVAEDYISAHLDKNVERETKPLKADSISTDLITDKVQVSDKRDFEKVNNKNKNYGQDDNISDIHGNISIIEESEQAQPTEFDLLLPRPSSDNVASDSTGEYSDQINQTSIIAQAIHEGYELPEADPDSDPPIDHNIASEPQGENSEEVIEQDIIDQAVLEGYEFPEVDPDSDPPTDKNIESAPEGENSEEVIEQDMIDRALLEGYELQEVDPDSHSRPSQNIVAEFEGEDSN